MSFFIDHTGNPSVIPYLDIVLPIVNTSSALFAYYLLFRPNFIKGQCVLTFVQSVFTTITGYEGLGTFLYIALIFVLFCNGFFKKKQKRFYVILTICWFVIILGVIPFGIERFIIEVAVSVFFLGFQIYLYNKYKEILKSLLPVSELKSQTALPNPGEKLYLNKLGLTERQVKIIDLYLKNNYSYQEIADICYVSVSTIKKDMINIFSLFGVKNIKELNILLLQYDLKF